MRVIDALVVSFLMPPTHAEVKQPGTVLTTLCAAEIRPTTQRIEVCYASIVGTQGAYLTVGNNVWVISNRPGAAVIEHVGTQTRGILGPRLSLEIRRGKLERLRGGAIEIAADRRTIRASNFQAVYHTQNVL